MKCFDPITITLKNPIWSIYEQRFLNTVPVPCGKCHGCIHRKIAEWSFRLEVERLVSECTYFVTLTYDNEHVPLNKYGKMTLDKTDLQKFFKDIRHQANRDPNYGLYEQHYFKTDLKKKKLSYYAIGEYGSKRHRPHYHLIMFNTSRWAIKQAWPYGEIDIQIPRSSAAISYLMKYLFKRILKKVPKNRAPEFSIMSKGLGLSYINKMKTWHKKNLDILYTVNESGMKVPMSKYYRDNIFTDLEKIQQIPIIKKSIDEEIQKEQQRLGDKYESRELSKRKSFSKKFDKKQRRRSDL